MKTALISGVSGGIGSQTAIKFIENGYFVIGQYNKGEEKVKELSEKYKENFFAYKADFSSDIEVDNMLKEISKSFKHIDVVVNNAGVGLYKLITETNESEWDKLFNVNVKSAYKLNNFALRSMISNASGNIVNVSSIWGLVGGSMEVAYSASKSALIAYTKALAKEVAPSNVRVNCVCPGVIDTKMNDIFSAEEKAELVGNTPLGRLGSALDVAELIWFLCSDNAKFITGQVVTVDGGYTL